MSDRCLCGPGGQGWSDGDGQLFFDFLCRLRAGDAADFLALAQHDQGGPKLDLEVAAQLAALAIFDLDVCDVAAFVQRLEARGVDREETLRAIGDFLNAPA